MYVKKTYYVEPSKIIAAVIACRLVLCHTMKFKLQTKTLMEEKQENSKNRTHFQYLEHLDLVITWLHMHMVACLCVSLVAHQARACCKIHKMTRGERSNENTISWSFLAQGRKSCLT